MAAYIVLYLKLLGLYCVVELRLVYWVLLAGGGLRHPKGRLVANGGCLQLLVLPEGHVAGEDDGLAHSNHVD
jgi:hypothetical protein